MSMKFIIISIFLFFLGKQRFRIINSEGKVVKEFLLSAGESRTLETTDFRSGLHFYQLFSNEETFETGKFLIQ